MCSAPFQMFRKHRWNLKPKLFPKNLIGVCKYHREDSSSQQTVYNFILNTCPCTHR